MSTRRIAVLLLVVASGAGGCRRDPPTFSRHIAPIVFERCAPCHRPGQGAPFTLLSYADVQPKAERIGRATSTMHMPPWLPDAMDPGFVGERRLAQDQIDLIQRWIKAGAPEGDPRDLPKPPVWTNDWQLGAPDVVLIPARGYTLKPQDGDVFRNLVLRVPLEADRYVRAVEFRPGDSPVHHAVLHLDRTAASRRRDGADGQPGFDGMGAMGAQEPDGHFIGWAPGRGPIRSADGMPWRLERGTDLVLELHLLPRKADITVRPSVALYFADAAPAAMPLMLKMGSKAIDIPPGAADYAIVDEYRLPVDVDLLSLYPHAHYLGKDMTVEATLPDGSRRPLLHIPHWSFHWQQDYQYSRPIALPKGTVLKMRFTYDNSAGNHDNPHSPPEHVMAGQRSTDEMGNLLLQVIPHSRQDRARLTADFAVRETLANIAGGEMVATYHPDNAENEAFLGGSYVDAGRIPEGIVHLERALRLDPRSAQAHNELGGARLKQQRVADAVAHFRQAVALAPSDDRLIYNVGKALSAGGRAAEAAREFQRALALNPDLWEAHDELGALLFGQGRRAEALAHLKRAVDLAPDSAIARSDYGGALAAAGRRDEAFVQIQRALEIDPDYAPAKENLARLRRR